MQSYLEKALEMIETVFLKNGITDILFTKQSSIDGDMHLLEEVEQAAFWMF